MDKVGELSRLLGVYFHGVGRSWMLYCGVRFDGGRWRWGNVKPRGLGLIFQLEGGPSRGLRRGLCRLWTNERKVSSLV